MTPRLRTVADAAWTRRLRARLQRLEHLASLGNPVAQQRLRRALEILDRAAARRDAAEAGAREETE